MVFQIGSKRGVAVEQRGAARIIRVDRPDARNALDSEALLEVAEQARVAAQDPAVRAIVIAGSDKVFVAGGDLKEFGSLKGPSGGRVVARKGRAMIEALRGAGVPLVAAIDGDAYGGGCELAVACDVRFARSGARLHWVQNALAVTTGWGATERLVSLVGAATTTRWLLAAQPVSVEEAHEHGLIDVIAKDETALDAALKWVDSVSKIAEEITREQLKLVRALQDPQRKSSLARELKAFARCWAHPAHQDAVDRFLTRSSRAK